MNVLVSTSYMQDSSQFGVVVADHISHSSSSQCHQCHHDHSVSCLCVKGVEPMMLHASREISLGDAGGVKVSLPCLLVNKRFSSFLHVRCTIALTNKHLDWNQCPLLLLDVGIISLQEVRLITCDVCKGQTK